MLENIEEIYCNVDDFCKVWKNYWQKHVLEKDLGTKKRRKRSTKMSLGEIATILILFHSSDIWCFKKFYFYLLSNHRDLFPKMISYQRFVALTPRVLPILTAMLESLKGNVTGIQFIDSTSYKVCHNLRSKRHKVFTGVANKGKTSTGWFFGFKIHVIFNDRGEIMSASFTKASTSDLSPVKKLSKYLKGKLFGDKGYISQKLAEELRSQGVQIITRLKKNMKNKLMDIKDKILLYKRSIVETIFGKLKQSGSFEHSRHRSPINAFCHILSALINYQMNPNKPQIKLKFQIP